MIGEGGTGEDHRPIARPVLSAEIRALNLWGRRPAGPLPFGELCSFEVAPVSLGSSGDKATAVIAARPAAQSDQGAAGRKSLISARPLWALRQAGLGPTVNVGRAIRARGKCIEQALFAAEAAGAPAPERGRRTGKDLGGELRFGPGGRYMGDRRGGRGGLFSPRSGWQERQSQHHRGEQLAHRAPPWENSLQEYHVILCSGAAGRRKPRRSEFPGGVPKFLAELRENFWRAKLRCGPPQKNSTRQIALRSSGKKFDAPNFSAEG